MGKTKRCVRGKGWEGLGVVSFNWASGSGTCSDNIKGQIYIKHCWEMLTHVGKGCWAERREEERQRKAIGSKFLFRGTRRNFSRQICSAESDMGNMTAFEGYC